MSRRKRKRKHKNIAEAASVGKVKRKLPMSIVGLFAWAYQKKATYRAKMPTGAPDGTPYNEWFIFKTEQDAAEFLELSSILKLMEAKLDKQDQRIVWLSVYESK